MTDWSHVGMGWAAGLLPLPIGIWAGLLPLGNGIMVGIKNVKNIELVKKATNSISDCAKKW